WSFTFSTDGGDPDPEPVEVTPAAVTFTERPGTADDTYSVPAVEGVEYLVGGEVVAAGTYPGSGTVTVTARATDGYVLADGATAPWSYTSSTAGGQQPQPQPPVTQEHGFFLSNDWQGGTAHAFHYGRFTDEVFIGDWDGD